jgi:hypothetical protein
VIHFGAGTPRPKIFIHAKSALISTPSKHPHYGYSIGQFVLSLLAISGLVLAAVVVLAFGLFSSLGLGPGPAGGSQPQTLPMYLFASGLLASALLLTPSAYYSLRRISGRPVYHFPRLPILLRPSILILALPLVLLLGYWISNNPGLSWLFLPILLVLAVGLPVLWIVYLAARGLPLGSPQRMWGVYGSGSTLGPVLILGTELVALIIYGVIGIIFLVNQPDLVEQLTQLVQSFQPGTVSEQELIQAVLPWLARPGVILAILTFAAVIVPLIEEALKPIGVWLLAGFKLTPAAGFAAGALCGAGYAFFESLALTGSGAEWVLSVSARIGTAVIHITNTALMGWALALAWREKRYLNLGLTYLFVVMVHGLWNGLAVINVIDTLLNPLGLQSPLRLAPWIAQAVPYILVGVTFVMFILLLWMNANQRRLTQAAHEEVEEATAGSGQDLERSETVL